MERCYEELGFTGCSLVESGERMRSRKGCCMTRRDNIVDKQRYWSRILHVRRNDHRRNFEDLWWRHILGMKDLSCAGRKAPSYDSFKPILGRFVSIVLYGSMHHVRKFVVGSARSVICDPDNLFWFEPGDTMVKFGCLLNRHEH